MTLRKSQKIIFWKNHRIVELRYKGKVIGWVGTKIIKPTAEEMFIQMKGGSQSENDREIN